MNLIPLIGKNIINCYAVEFKRKKEEKEEASTKEQEPNRNWKARETAVMDHT